MIAAAPNLREAGIRKAAILVASLDRAAADRLLAQLGPHCAALVRQAVAAVDTMDVQERRRVIDEFRRIGSLVPDKCPPGIDLESPLARQLGHAASAANRIESLAATFSDDGAAGQTRLSALPAVPAAGAGDAPPFSFLRKAADKQLSELLGEERPQTIAMVLSQLPPERAGAVLTRLAPPLQVEVVRRLADLDSSDAETLREVEQALLARLSRQFAIERKQAAGPETIAKILAACDRGAARSILDNLAEQDAPLAEQLGRRPIHFDELAQFDDAALEAVFGAAGPEVVLAALLGAPPHLVDRVLGRLHPDEARLLRGKLDCPAPIRLSDVESARQQIAALADQMSHRHPPKTTWAA
jgi:flagellar motor switch protein FliG